MQCAIACAVQEDEMEEIVTAHYIILYYIILYCDIVLYCIVILYATQEDVPLEEVEEIGGGRKITKLYYIILYYSTLYCTIISMCAAQEDEIDRVPLQDVEEIGDYGDDKSLDQAYIYIYIYIYMNYIINL